MGLFPPAPGGGAEVEHGYKGKGSLLHLLTDYNGNPLAITTTPANGDERQEVQKLLDRSGVKSYGKKLCKRNMIILEADKGYDSGKIRQVLLNQNIFPFIPRRRIGGKSLDRPDQSQVGTFFSIKSVRWKVERTFSWLKRKCRRLLLRWERLPIAWNAFATLSLIYYWKEILFR
jgi:transposase